MKKIVYDAVLMRPGCVLLQAFGGTLGSLEFGMLFPSETWLLAPTPNMKLYSATDDELKKISEITIAHHEKGKTDAKPTR